MVEISAELVKQLRLATNVSMMECKKALTDAQGDIEKATRLLRERGVAMAAKKATRATNQGLVASHVTPDGKTVSLIEVNCETDFVARNPTFQAFVREMAEKAAATDGSITAEARDKIVAKVTEIGENITVRRNTRYTLQGTGRLGSYIHMGGKIGVIVEAGCQKPATVDSPMFKDLIRDLTLHIAASRPQYKDPSEIPADVVKSEREIYAKQVQGKPANVLEKIVDGKMRKFHEEICLLQQPFVKEPKQSITQVVQAVEKALADTIAIRRFAVYQLGA